MAKRVKARICSGALDDGTAWDELIVTPAAAAQCEMEMKARGVTFDERPMSAETIMVWCAARRADVIPRDMTFEQFNDHAIAADLETAELDPTTLPGRSAPGTDSPSPQQSTPA